MHFKYNNDVNVLVLSYRLYYTMLMNCFLLPTAKVLCYVDPEWNEHLLCIIIYQEEDNCIILVISPWNSKSHIQLEN